MSDLVKWAWLILLIILFSGPHTIYILLGDLLVILLVWIFKPEYLSKMF